MIEQTDMARGIFRKARESAELNLRFFEIHAEQLVHCISALAGRFGRGGRLLVMGNGGSACDAQHVAVEFAHPIIEKRRALPAYSLSDSFALASAVGNDSDFSRIFAEQVDLFAQPEDTLLGISTSGCSGNVNRALRRGRELGLLTIGFAGRDGGENQRAQKTRRGLHEN